MNDETRLDELLAEQATQGISDLDHAALALMLEDAPGLSADYYDDAAAALDLALNADAYALEDAMPTDFAARLTAQGEEFLRNGEAALAPLYARASTPDAEVPSIPAPTPSASPIWMIGGWLAAAAAIAVMATGFFDTPATSATDATADVATVEAFIAEYPDTVDLAWSPGGDATGTSATGRVVWSQSAQRGFMVFDDLAVNDVTVEQYQLWIFDADREHPVDGGVFDIRAGAGQVVPITAKLDVTTPTLFAVTVERPGGVVVSDKSRITLAADPNAAK